MELKLKKDVNIEIGGDTIPVYETLKNLEGNIEYSNNYLTFIPKSNGTFKFSATQGSTLKYSIDGGSTWTTLANNTNTPTITQGTKVMWKGSITPTGSTGIGTFSASVDFDAFGSVMSLLYEDDFQDKEDLSSYNYCFQSLFTGNIHLIDASNLSLPATILSTGCYIAMFSGCTNLTAAPKLPATRLESACYTSMFTGCGSLQKAPVLAALEVKDGSYASMFSGCTSLSYIKALFLTDPSSNNMTQWVAGVAQSGTFVKNADATWTGTGINAVPEGWTVNTLKINDPLNEIGKVAAAALNSLDSRVTTNTNNISSLDSRVTTNTTAVSELSNKMDSLEGIKVVEKDLYIKKNEGWYPVNHPDISTQPSLLPQRFGNIEMYEVASRVQDDKLIDVPSNVRIVSSDAFNSTNYASINCQKSNNQWQLVNKPFNPDWVIVRYIGQDKGYYYYYNSDDDQPITFGADVCVYDTGEQTMSILTFDEYFNNYTNLQTLEPIGVVVIPASHMTDGKARVMSLVDMSYNTPETGNISGNEDPYMYWGGYGVDIDTLTNFDKVVTGETEGGTIGVNSYAILPNEGGTYDGSPHAPSPYLSDGTKNPLYFYNTTVNNIDFSTNALSDLDGKTNTDKIIAKVTADWSGNTVTNSYEAGNYPAACCTRRFHTAGTNAGDWYLPACGELGYVYPRKTSINNTLKKLNSIGKTSSLVRSLGYWSSSEYNSNTARGVGFGYGGVNLSNKDGSYYVRAFLRV